MITILVNNQNQMIVTTSELIMQHSQNVHTIQIFVPEEYNNFNMKDFSAYIEIVPPNQRYKHLYLQPTEISRKEGYVQYDIEIPSEFTMFAGDMSMQMTFTKVDDNTYKTYIRHTTSCTLKVEPIEKWSELITDDALSDLDQRIVKIEQAIKVTSDLVDALNSSKADNHRINEDGDLVLTANGLDLPNTAVSVALPGTEDIEDKQENGIINADEIYEEELI